MKCPACNGRGRRLYGREVEDGCDDCEATGQVPDEHPAPGVPEGATAWDAAPPEALAAWRTCVRSHTHGGNPPARFSCAGWVFLLGDGGKRYYPAREGS